MSRFEPEGVPPLSLTIGVGLIGFTISLLVYGITTGQAILYVVRYGRRYSTFWTRWLVIALWAIDTAQMILVSDSMYHFCVSYHGDPFQLSRITWFNGTTVILTEVGNNLVRMGYAYRIWKFNNRRAIVPIVIIVFSLLLFAMALIYGIDQLRIHSFAQSANTEWTFYVSSAANIVADVIIAAAMLLRFRGLWTGIKRFDTIIQTITVYAIDIGIISIILNALSVVMFIIYPATFLYISSFWVLAKVHMCSFFAVLHAEKDLAERASVHSDDGMPKGPMFTTALRIESENTAPHKQPETMELSDFPESGPEQDPRESISQVPRT